MGGKPKPALFQPRQHSLVFVGRFPQLVRSHSAREVVVLHDVLEVQVRHQLKLEEQRRSAQRKGETAARQSRLPPTSSKTLSRFVAFMMKSGYPTML